MNERFEYWKLSLERLRTAPSLDWNKAGRIVAEIARGSTTATLRHAAEQALPAMRQAMHDSANRDIVAAAMRHLEEILEIFHGRVAPRFGRRAVLPEQMAREDRARMTLGLPLAVRLTCEDIHRAYRRLAKTMHPDIGGSEQAFHDLIAARDLLINPGAHNDT